MSYLRIGCIRLILQNKANGQDAEMNTSASITNYYENICSFRRCENKPNQTQRCVCPSPGNSLVFSFTFQTLSFLCLSYHSDSAGSGDVLYAVRFADLDKGLDFFLRAADFYHQKFLADIDNLALEHFDKRKNFRPFRGRRGNADKHKVS